MFKAADFSSNSGASTNPDKVKLADRLKYHQVGEKHYIHGFKITWGIVGKSQLHIMDCKFQ